MRAKGCAMCSAVMRPLQLDEAAEVGAAKAWLVAEQQLRLLLLRKQQAAAAAAESSKAATA